MHDLKQSWIEEKRSAYLYRVISAYESNEVKKKLFQDLSLVAEKQALIWEKKLQKTEENEVYLYYLDFRTRIVGFLLRYFSAQSLRFILSAMKVRGMSIYSDISAQSSPALPHAVSNIERRHKGLNTAGNLRAAVFGVNDGLVSNISLLLGLVGGHSSTNTIILSGIAGLLAGAFSMGAGEYISMRSQREFFEYQIALEKEELEFYPEEEVAELAYIYQARGLSKEEAQKLAENIIRNPDRALDTLAREELGLNPNELGSPAGAALYSFISFAAGALIPLMPFIFGNASHNLAVSIMLTAISLFVIGAILSLFTNRNAVISGLRMLFIGIVAGFLTYEIGKMVSVTLS